MASRIAENAKRIMTERGVKQRKVAEMANINEKTLSAMMCGRKIITADDAAALADALDVSPNELFGFAEDGTGISPKAG